MATFRVFKTNYNDRNGKKRQAKKWYVEFRDHNDIIRRLALFTSKIATEEFARNIIKLVDYAKATGGQTDPALVNWLTGLPTNFKEKLVSLGLIAPERAAATRLFADHLLDFEMALKAKKNTAKHIKLTLTRVRRIVTDCGFKHLSDISPERVLSCLHQLQQGSDAQEGISNQTYNYHLGAFKHFCNWAVETRRLPNSPVAHLETLNTTTDRRHDRQTLSPEKLGYILQAALASDTTYRRLNGRDRHYLYLLAMSSGLRAGELSTLTPESFSLDHNPPTVTVAAADTKNRQPVKQPLPPDVAEALQEFIIDKTEGQLLWPGSWYNTAARMLRIDLAGATELMQNEDPNSAGIPYVVDGPDGPLYADFHSLRHSYIAMLDHAGLTLKQAMQLARHSDPKLTMARYGRAQLHDLGAAVGKMPSLVGEEKEIDNQKMEATGTDGKSVLADCLARKGGFQATSVDANRKTTIWHK